VLEGAHRPVRLRFALLWQRILPTGSWVIPVKNAGKMLSKPVGGAGGFRPPTQDESPITACFLPARTPPRFNGGTSKH